jgi:hypothetical protein
MELVSELILALWGAAILARFGALAALTLRGLSLRYPFLWIFLAFGTVRSAYLVHGYVTGGSTGYTAAWVGSQPVVLGFAALPVLEVFAVQARMLRRFFWPGVVILGIFTAISVSVVLGTAGWWIGSATDYALDFFTRRYDATCFGVVLLSHLALRIMGPSDRVFGRPYAPNAQRYVRGLLVLLGSSIVADGTRGGLFTSNAVSQFVLLGGAIAAYVLWARMDRAGEQLPPYPAPVSDEEALAAERFVNAVIRATAAEIKRILRDLFRMRPLLG